MQQISVEETAAALAGTLRRNPAGEPIGVLGPTLLRLIARGEPVSPADIASETGLSIDEVMARLASLPDAELDEGGNLVGMGLTLRPTQHRFKIDGRELYTWCALDTLMYPSLLGVTAQVESPCHATGERIRVAVGPIGVLAFDPPTTVVSIVLPEDSRNIRGSFCNEVHFFRSRQVAGGWLDDHPGAMLVSVDEAFNIGRMLNDATYGCCS